jgi:hypothetical protein
MGQPIGESTTTSTSPGTTSLEEHASGSTHPSNNLPIGITNQTTTEHVAGEADNNSLPVVAQVVDEVEMRRQMQQEISRQRHQQMVLRWEVVHAVIDVPESAPSRSSTISAHRKPWTRLQWCGHFLLASMIGLVLVVIVVAVILPNEEKAIHRIQATLHCNDCKHYAPCYYPFQVHNYTIQHRHSMLQFIGWPMKTLTGTTSPTPPLWLSPSLPLQRSMSFWNDKF